MNYKYKSIRPKLWEILDKNDRALGRIRHVLKPKNSNFGWQASDGKFYQNAKDAVLGLVDYKKMELQKA